MNASLVLGGKIMSTHYCESEGKGGNYMWARRLMHETVNDDDYASGWSIEHVLWVAVYAQVILRSALAKVERNWLTSSSSMAIKSTHLMIFYDQSIYVEGAHQYEWIDDQRFNDVGIIYQNQSLMWSASSIAFHDLCFATFLLFKARV